jgi:hypothetical protein
VLDRIRAETSETPRLVELPSKVAPIGVRALIEAIVGRELKHGEFTEAIVGRHKARDGTTSSSLTMRRGYTRTRCCGYAPTCTL